MLFFLAQGYRVVAHHGRARRSAERVAIEFGETPT